MFKRSLLSSSIAAAMVLSSYPLAAQNNNDNDLLEEVIVTGLRASLTRSIDIKRNSYQMVDAIVAEDIGKFPDNNVAESMQRISGVQVTDREAGEVSSVYIRGLDDVTTTVNGRNLFTASGRSLALADIPASLLHRVDVYKTRSANLIETGIAGQIDIHTHRPFNFNGPQVTLAARGIYQDQADKVDPTISALFSNRWDTGAGEFGALLNLSYARTQYRDQSVTAGAMFPFATENPPAGWVPFEIIRPTDGRAPDQELWEPGLESGLPFVPGSTLTINGEEVPYLLSRDAIFASDFTGKRERPAANISLQFAPDDRSEYTFEAFYNGYRNESFNSLLFSFVDWWGDLGPSPEDGIAVYDGTNVVKSRDRIGSPYMFTSGDLLTGKTDSYLYALGGNWDINDNFQLKSELTYQTSEYTEDFFAMRFEKVTHEAWVDFNSGGGLPAFGFRDNPATTDIDESDLTDETQWAMAQLYDNGFRSKGDALTFTADADYQIELGIINNISFGLRYDDRGASEAQRTQDGPLCNASVDACQLSSYPGLLHVNSGFFDGKSDVPTSWVAANGHYIRQNADQFRSVYNDNVGGDFTLSSDLQLLDNFKVDEATTAAYIQVDFESEIAGRLIDGQFGVRYVNVDTDMTFYDYAGGVTTVSHASANADKFLPSLMVRYNITDDLLARFSYGETLRRPQFSQLNSNIIYVEDVTNIGYGTASGGNPDLKPTHSKNYDLSLEWYFADSSSLYGALFHRDVDNMVIDFRRRINYEGYDYILSAPDNASNGTLKGLELGLIYFPDNLPSLLDGLGVQASYTWLDSEQDIPLVDEDGFITSMDTTPMFGVSDQSYSIVLAYDKNDLEMRLSYVWRKDFLYNYEAAQFANPLGIYRKPETSMDFQLSYSINNNLIITFDATNLTNEIYQSYYEYPDTHNFGSSIYSRTYALGARYSFF